MPKYKNDLKRTSLTLSEQLRKDVREKGYSLQPIITLLLKKLVEGKISWDGFPNDEPANGGAKTEELEKRIFNLNTQNRQQMDLIAAASKKREEYKQLLKELYSVMDNKMPNEYDNNDFDLFEKIKAEVF